MLFVTFDCDIFEDQCFLALQDADEGFPWMFLRLVAIAKKINALGKVLNHDGKPHSSVSMARLHHGPGRAHVSRWDALLSLCLEMELLSFDDGVWSVIDWRRWHRKPSDDKEAVNKRVQEHRNRVKSKETPCNASETPSNECNASKHSIAQHSIAEAEQSTKHSKAEHSTAEVTPGAVLGRAVPWLESSHSDELLRKASDRCRSALNGSFGQKHEHKLRSLLTSMPPPPVGYDAISWGRYLLDNVATGVTEAVIAKARDGQPLNAGFTVHCIADQFKQVRKETK